MSATPTHIHFQQPKKGECVLCEMDRADKAETELAAKTAELEKLERKLVYEFSDGPDIPVFRDNQLESEVHEQEELVTAERCNRMVHEIARLLNENRETRASALEEAAACADINGDRHTRDGLTRRAASVRKGGVE